jgi:hypothetical protein
MLPGQDALPGIRARLLDANPDYARPCQFDEEGQRVNRRPEYPAHISH